MTNGKRHRQARTLSATEPAVRTLQPQLVLQLYQRLDYGTEIIDYLPRQDANNNNKIL